MAWRCEAGHSSASDDYCDTCGLPVRQVAETPAAPAPPEPPRTCPHCHTATPPRALFCEACGYDYTTGTMPRADAASLLGITRKESTMSPDAASTSDKDGAAPAQAPEADLLPGEDPAADASASKPAEMSGTNAAPDGEADEADEATNGRPAPRRERYVAEVWIDPDWYAVQQSPDPMPSVGLPTIVLLGESNLVGRASRSRKIFPEIDCSLDTGVSREQARISTDGSRWYVEDLGSANGTFVSPAGGPLPEQPITTRQEISSDDRIYVGAWTRLVVRKATKEELDDQT